jgi:NAD+ kinase
MKQIAIFAKKIVKSDFLVLQELLQRVEQYGYKAILEKELALQLHNKFQWPLTSPTFESYLDLQEGFDLLISVGGDGTFLKAVSFIRDSKVPILGINIGRLGFLSNLSKNQIDQTLERFASGAYEFQKRSLLRVHTENGIFGDQNFALNELTLQKKDTSTMIKVHTFLDDKFLNTYWADGLIVGTPTGSTAYSLSCGGPIITPGCQVHILTPIAPHNLNVRPVVVPDHLPITLEVEGRDRSYLLTLDGHSRQIKQGEKVTITKAEFMINVVKFEDNNFLDTIRNKMLWGSDTRNEI